MSLLRGRARRYGSADEKGAGLDTREALRIQQVEGLGESVEANMVVRERNRLPRALQE